MPKVAATLATAFIGFQAGLLNQMVLNAVLAVMVVTATLGPILTEQSVTRLKDPSSDVVPVSFGEEAAVLDGKIHVESNGWRPRMFSLDQAQTCAR